MIKRFLKRSSCLFLILLTVGCGKPYEETEIEQSNNESQNMVSESISVDAVSENEAGDQAEENVSQNMAEEIEVIELSNGLYAYSTSQVAGEYERNGVTGWVRIQNWNPEKETIESGHNRQWIAISNVYGTIADIRMDGYSQITICYEDEKGESGEAVVPLDFYPSEGNSLEPVYGWITPRLLMFNNAELTNKTELPTEVWREVFSSEGKEYAAVYSRISPIYREAYSDFFNLYVADYRFAILQGDEVLYEIKLYGMDIGYEELHFMEDVDGDGMEDFILISNPGCYQWNTVPYVFVWDPEQETCISGGTIIPEKKDVFEIEEEGSDHYPYETVLYDRDTGIFYDASNTERNAIYGHDIHDMVILSGAKFIDGEWKTVYELYLGRESEDYVREIKYDGEGNVISENVYSEAEQYDVVNSIYTGCELSLCSFYPDWTREEIVMDGGFSYITYVRNDE